MFVEPMRCKIAVGGIWLLQFLPSLGLGAAWPTRETYAAIIAGKDLQGFRLRVTKSEGRSHRCLLSLQGDLTGTYELASSHTGLFRNKMASQAGSYSFRVRREQFVALLGVLERSSFASLDQPEKLVIGTATIGVALRYAGRERLLRFPTDIKPYPAEFTAIWDGLVGILAECDMIPEKALRVELGVPKVVKRGAAIPIDIWVENIGKVPVDIPHPASSSAQGRLSMRVRTRSLPAGKQASTALQFPHSEDMPKALTLVPSERVTLHFSESLSLDRIGDYGVVVEIDTALPEGEDAEKGIVASIQSNEAFLRVE